MKRWGPFLLCIALGACRIDVSEAPDDVALLNIDVVVVDTPGVSRVDLRALFLPGRNERGESRPVLADSLVVFGVSLAPERVGPDASLSFNGSWPVASAIAGSAEPLVLPATDGLRPPPLADGVPLVATTAPDTLLVGEQLVLPLRRDPLAGADDAPARWGLDVTTPERRVLNITGDGLLPDTIKVARSLLPDVADARLRLQVLGLREYELLGGDYRVRIAQYTNIIRVLRFTDPAP